MAGIAATTTYQGLKCTAVLDDADYPEGAKVSDERMRYLEERVISRHDEPRRVELRRPPRPRPAPEPEPPPAPAPAPTWKDWPPWPASPTSAPCWRPSPCPGRPSASSACTWPAGRPPQTQRRHPRAPLRGHRHRRRLPPPPRHALPAARRAARRPPVHHQPRRPPHHPAPRSSTASPRAAGGPRISTRARLRDHAATSGITINGITAQVPHDDGNQNDTPETAN